MSGLTFRFGLTTFTSGASSSALSRSDSMASAMPGYCTLVTTCWPSGRTARWTWPIDALAIGSGSHSANTPSTGAPYCSSMTPRMTSTSTGSDCARSAASSSW